MHDRVRDALGLPIRLIASPGQSSDIACAGDLIDDFATDVVLGGKGCDADDLCGAIELTGATVGIPPRRNHYDKLLASFTGFVKLATIVIWLR